MSEALPGVLQVISFHRFTGERLSEDICSFARDPSDQDLFIGSLENGCLKMSEALPGILQIKNDQDLFIVSLENGWLKMSEALPGILQIKIFRRFTGEWLSEDV